MPGIQPCLTTPDERCSIQNDSVRGKSNQLIKLKKKPGLLAREFRNKLQGATLLGREVAPDLSCKEYGSSATVQ